MKGAVTSSVQKIVSFLLYAIVPAITVKICLLHVKITVDTPLAVTERITVIMTTAGVFAEANLILWVTCVSLTQIIEVTRSLALAVLNQQLSLQPSPLVSVSTIVSIVA